MFSGKFVIFWSKSRGRAKLATPVKPSRQGGRGRGKSPERAPVVSLGQVVDDWVVGDRIAACGKPAKRGPAPVLPARGWARQGSQFR